MTDALNSLFHPELEGLTENERAWVGFLRLAGVQAVRRVFSDYQSSREAPG